MDITFACESCGQSIVINDAAAGQLVGCPKCGASLEVPYKFKPLDKAVTPSPPPDKTAGASSSLPKILTILVLIAVMVGGFFAYNFLKDQQAARAKAVAEEEAARARAKVAAVVAAAKDAVDLAHWIKVHEIYDSEMLGRLKEVNDKLDSRATSCSIQNVKTGAWSVGYRLEDFRMECENVERFSKVNDLMAERVVGESQRKASAALDEADRLYAELKQQ
ncbi:MAG: hypothetical protein ABSC38_06055 [Verrucomicrobiia bacterium]